MTDRHTAGSAAAALLLAVALVAPIHAQSNFPPLARAAAPSAATPAWLAGTPAELGGVSRDMTTAGIGGVSPEMAPAGIESPRSRQQQPTPEQMAEMMRRHRELAQPGPEHERLAAMTGTWDVELKMWPAPGAEPVTSAGTMSAETIIGGRFLVQTMSLADTDPGGEQMSIIGFDRRSGEYIVMGMDTAGTYWVTARGPADASGDRAVLAGEDHDAIVGFTQIYDFVLSWPDDDTFVVEIIFKDEIHTRGGPPFKMVEVTSRRRQ